MSAEELLLNSVIDNLDVVVRLRRKNDKLKRINISLNSIKYYYSLNSKIKSETTQN